MRLWAARRVGDRGGARRLVSIPVLMDEALGPRVFHPDIESETVTVSIPVLMDEALGPRDARQAHTTSVGLNPCFDG